MTRITAPLTALIVGATIVTRTVTAQERTQGVSMHMLPKRVVEIAGKPWGLAVDYSPRLKPESQQPVIQTGPDLLSYFRKQDPGVQENGIWIVITNPDAYSEAEKVFLENVKSMCRKEKIPLFICRASKLPNGWERFDR